MRLSLCFASLALAAVPSVAQQCGVTVTEPAKLRVARKGETEQRLKVSLPAGCHANSNTPSEAFLIPLKLTWNPGALDAAGTEYPKATMEKYEFSEKPISVVSGQFEIVTKFKRSATAQPGCG